MRTPSRWTTTGSSSTPRSLPRATGASPSNRRKPAACGAICSPAGFLHVDDNYGLDESFRVAVRVLFPDRRLIELPFGHPIYHCLYSFPGGLPKIHEHHGGPPHGYGILDKGRVVLFYSYNTDLNDGWESPEVHKDSPARREAALRMGLNLLTYALTH